MAHKEIIVIGAGIGGLSAAIRLARQGHRVTVLERNPYVGGKMATVLADGYYFDTGPSVITMRHVIDDLFTSVGRNLSDYLTLLPVEPLTRYFFADGTRLDLSRDLSHTLGQIAQLNAHDVEGYLAFLAQAAYLDRVTSPVFTYGPPPTPASFLRVPFTDMLRVGAESLTIYSDLIKRYVHSPQLQQILGRFATYVGSSPYLASAMLAIIAHLELNQGVWYPQGGIYTIARALEKLARELGVTIATGMEVERLSIASQRDSRTDQLIIDGVILRNGDRVRGDAVVANVDVATVYEKFLPAVEAFPKRLAALDKMEPSCSGFVMLLGVQGDFPALAHHNIFFSKDYRREFDYIFNSPYPPEDPTIYLAITAKTDLSHAPPGGENWFVLVNVPPASAGYDWEENRRAYERQVLNRLAERGFDVRNKLRVVRSLTPLDLQRMNGARRGALYGVSFNDRLAPFKRPGNRAPDARGLYFVGGTTHPGGGVPMVMLSGKVVADMIAEDV